MTAADLVTLLKCNPTVKLVINESIELPCTVVMATDRTQPTGLFSVHVSLISLSGPTDREGVRLS